MELKKKTARKRKPPKAGLRRNANRTRPVNWEPPVPRIHFLRGVDATHLFGKIRGEQPNKLGAELMTRREVSGLGVNSERREPLRRAQFDFDLAPLAIMCAVARLVSNNILVA